MLSVKSSTEITGVVRMQGFGIVIQTNIDTEAT